MFIVIVSGTRLRTKNDLFLCCPRFSKLGYENVNSDRDFQCGNDSGMLL